MDPNSLVDATLGPAPATPNQLAEATVSQAPPPTEGQQKLAHATDYYRQNAEKFFGRGTESYISERIPGVSAVDAVNHYRKLYGSVKKIEAGTAEDEDYYTAAQHLAKQEYESQRSTAGQTLDAITHAPGMLAEWAATGGAAGGAKIAAEKALGGMASRFLGRAAIAGAGVAGRTLAMPSTYGKIAERTIGQGPQGELQTVNPLAAAGQGLASSAIENAVFTASGHLGLPENSTYVKSVLKGLGAMEANGDLQRLAQLSPKGGALWNYVAAQTPEEKAAALQEFVSNAGAVLAMESGLHAVQHLGGHVDMDKLGQTVAEHIADPAKQALRGEPDATPLPAETPAPAPQPSAAPATPPGAVDRQGIQGQAPEAPEDVSGLKPTGPWAPKQPAEPPQPVPGAEGNADQPVEPEARQPGNEVAGQPAVPPAEGPAPSKPGFLTPIPDTIGRTPQPDLDAAFAEDTSKEPTPGPKPPAVDLLAEAMGPTAAERKASAPPAPPAPPEPEPAKGTKLDKMRAKQKQRGDVQAPAPRPLAPSAPKVEAAAPEASPEGPRAIAETTPKDLMDRIDRGEGDLTEQEKAVLQERLLNATGFRPLAAKLGVSQETVRNREKAALAKLGVTGSVDQLHLARSAEMANLLKAEEGDEAAKTELHRTDPRFLSGNALINQLHELHGQVDELYSKMTKEKTSGTLTDAKSADYRSKLQSLYGAIEALQEPHRQTGGAEGGTASSAQEPGTQEGVSPAGMGAMGGSLPGGKPAPSGAPGTQTPTSAPAPAKPMELQHAVDRTFDYVKELAGQMFPRTHRLDRETGEALSRMVASPQFVEEAKRYFSNILGIDKMDSEERRAVGATFLEMRFRHAREYFHTEAIKASNDAIDARDKAQRTSDPAEKARLLRESREGFARANELGEKQRGVGTLIGQADSPLTDEQTFQDYRTSPNMKGFLEAWRQEFVPEMEKNYRGAKGLDEHDPINAPTQIPSYPINAKAIDLDQAPRQGGVAIGGRGDLDNVRLRKMGFTNSASLGAPAYEIDIGSILGNSLERGTFPARQAEAYRTAEANKVGAWGSPGDHPKGWMHIPDSKPPRGTQEAEQGQTFYVHPDAAGEWRKAMAVDEPFGNRLSALKTSMDVLNKLNLASVGEIAAHIANNVTAQFKPGMRPGELYTEAANIIQKNPATQDRIKELARMGAMHGGQEAVGVLPKSMQQVDPTYHWNRLTGGIIDILQKTTRLQLDNAYTRLVDSKMAPDTEQGRRDFINQAVGQYNNRASNPIVQFFKDTGLGSFATAGVTFTTQGIRTAHAGGTNVKATSAGADAQLRAGALAKLLPLMAAPMISNYLFWGNIWGDDKTPIFAFKTGEGEHFDPMAFTGVRRGLRASGANALIEGNRQGVSNKKILHQAGSDFLHSALHPFTGPPIQFLETAATGENTMGHRLSKNTRDVGENIAAAVKNANPIIGTLTGSDRPKSARTFTEDLTKMAGPFGIKKSRGIR